MAIFINATSSTLTVNGEKVIPGREVDVSMAVGQKVFISSERGNANVSFDGLLPNCDSSMGEISVSVASANVVIISQK